MIETDEWLDNILLPYMEQIVNLLNSTIGILTESQRENEKWIKYLTATLENHVKDTEHHPSNNEINSRLLDYEQRIDGKQAFLYKNKRDRI